ncbi:MULTISPECIES: NYN domain-containing protein [Pseudofrankia]|uniref:NYN domain-containing protein n=1 Tax=Pseudofrankia TaxID=2994363 RepID=UPI000234C833|nr:MULTISPECIES: NYN domain-containing protein [Pseudofrankia]OHV36403.1 hypothetical protein BCD49_19295 [Pseudofrankia sp. EUN1h]
MTMRERPQPPAVDHDSGRFPVAVVVDGWNVRSQVSRAFGQARHVTYPGLVGGLRAYGLEVVSADLALGIEPADGPRSVTPGGRLAAALADNNEFARRWETTPGARTLPGRLRLSDTRGELEEKLVDVLCAVQICRLATQIQQGDSSARGIVLLSRDMDLIPACQFAHELDVPVWVAARETVHRRRRDHGWLLLDDAALATMAGFRGRAVLERRATVARLLHPAAGMPPPPCRVIVSSVDGPGRSVRLHSRDGGVPASAPVTAMPRGVRPGRSVDLFPIGVDINEHNGFPILLLDRRPNPGLPSGIATGVVERCLDQLRRQIRVAGATHVVYVPVGAALPGERTLLLMPAGGRALYIGPAGAVGGQASGQDRRVRVVTITEVRPTLSAPVYRQVREVTGRPMEYAVGQLEFGHRTVIIAHQESRLATGDRLAVITVGVSTGAQATVPLMMQLGSRLPERKTMT